MTAEQRNEDVETDLTPMIDVAFLMIIFFMCLPFKTLDAKLAGFLPTGKGVIEDDTQPPELFMIRVHIVGRDEVDRAWGPPDQRSIVQMPSRVVYRFEGGDSTEDLEAVGRHIRLMQRAAKGLPRAKVRGEIKARPRVPHKYVIAVMNEFAKAKIKKVDFYGSKIPDRRLLNTSPLPFPER